MYYLVKKKIIITEEGDTIIPDIPNGYNYTCLDCDDFCIVWIDAILNEMTTLTSDEVRKLTKDKYTDKEINTFLTR
jgi:hypothetical protein